MERNITITLEKAVEWYNNGNDTLKEVALQAFTKDELIYDFKNITTFKKACKVLNLNYNFIKSQILDLTEISKASAAMFKLNIIRKALNWGQDLHLTKNPGDSCIYYPYNPFASESSTFYENELNLGKVEVIGKVKSEGTLYNVLGGCANTSGTAGLGDFHSGIGVGVADARFGFLGCASKEIAEHFSKYFGMLITEAKYADMVDFEIISDH